MGKADAVRRLAPVARRQHGPFTRRQALQSGFSASSVQRNVAHGWWIDLHRGVYCDAVIPASLERDASAAVLACGPTAVVSHRTAGLLWSLDVPKPALPEVTVLPSGRARPVRVTVHKTDRLSVSEAAVRDGIRMTSPMRTLLDLASCIEPDLLELALDRLWRRSLVHPPRLAVYLSDDWCDTRRGTAALRRLISERIGDRPSGSDIETLFLQMLRDAHLPLPARQHPV